MFNTEKELLEALFARKNQTYGADNLKKLLNDLDNPQDRLISIQIGGTNGKGSTTNYLRSILNESEYRVGTFTSPHLVTHRDRIRIDDQMISDEKFVMYANKTYQYWEPYQLSMFEIDFLISVLYFIDHKVDFAIYEVGLGGRLDATSVLHPKLIGITNISYDHMGILGNTISEIAQEKAGIFKEKTAIITNEKGTEALEVLKKNADAKHSKLTILDSVAVKEVNNDYYISKPVPYVLKNQAYYQIENSQLALNLALALDIKLNDPAKALQSAQWAGRFEQVSHNVFIDGAHNEAGIEALIKTLQTYPKPWTVVFAVLKDKDYNKMIADLAAVSDNFILTEFDFPRALKVAEYKGQAVESKQSYKEAINSALQAQSTGTVIITGSLYFISEARHYLKNMK